MSGLSTGRTTRNSRTKVASASHKPITQTEHALVHVAAIDKLGHAPTVANGEQAQAQADDHGDAHDEIVIHA